MTCKLQNLLTNWGRHGRDRMGVGFTTTCATVHITTKVVSSNLLHGEMYSIQHYVMQFVSDLRQVSDFLRVLRFLPLITTDHHDITEILLKVSLSTTTLILICQYCFAT